MNLIRIAACALVGLGIGHAILTVFDLWNDHRKAGRHA